MCVKQNAVDFSMDFPLAAKAVCDFFMMTMVTWVQILLIKQLTTTKSLC